MNICGQLPGPKACVDPSQNRVITECAPGLSRTQHAPAGQRRMPCAYTPVVEVAVIASWPQASNKLDSQHRAGEHRYKPKWGGNSAAGNSLQQPLAAEFFKECVVRGANEVEFGESREPL